jgi:hypothetical protein
VRVRDLENPRSSPEPGSGIHCTPPTATRGWARLAPVRIHSARFGGVALLAAFAAFSSGCESIRALTQAQPATTRSGAAGFPEQLERHLARIEHLESMGRIREAIDATELALVDYHHEAVLRDHRTRLRSMQQVMFQRDLADAENSFLKGNTYTARVILKSVRDYGDEEMLRVADLRSEEYAEIEPALYRSSGTPEG